MNQPLHLFFHAEALSRYDSSLRTELTACFQPNRQRLASFCVLVRSKIVAMGVSVANLALGGIVDMTSDAKHFNAKLDRCLLHYRVEGFSSKALVSLTDLNADVGR